MNNSYLNIFLIIFMISFSYTQDEEVNSAFTGSFGSVTLNDQIYNHFSFKPEMSVGKLGLGMDLYFYFDEDGKLYHDNWNFSSSENSFRTVVDKIYYIRWGKPYDDIYFRFGALPNVTMGHGSLVKNYSNVIDFPRYRRKGITFNYKLSKVAMQFIHSDFKEIDAPSLVALSTSFEFVDKFNLNFTLATDSDQYNGLFDSDDDNIPDLIDDFPNDEDFWHENQLLIDQLMNDKTDLGDPCWDITGDTITDENGNGMDDTCENIVENLQLEIDNSYDSSSILNGDVVSGLSFGLSYDLTSRFLLYSEFAQLFGKTSNPYHPNDLEYNDYNTDLGYGFIPIGFRANWDKITFSIDYRQNTEKFLFHYWDQNYDNSRVKLLGSSAITKEQNLYKYGEAQGVKVSLVSNIKYLGVSFSYSHMNSDIWDDASSSYKSDDNHSIYTKLDIDTSMLYKVRIAEMFYQQRNIDSPFDFDPNEDSLFGYNVGIEMSDNMVLILKGRKSYACDDDHCDPIKTTQIETQIIF